MISEKIVKWAMLFDGIKEKGNNEGWEDVYFEEIDSTFQSLMESVGWRYTEPWCAYFAELIWKLAYLDHPLSIDINKLFSGSAVQTWKNFKESGFICSAVPVVGAVVIWRNYKKGVALQSGHAAIVVKVEENLLTIKTVEGNVSATSEREGDEVAMRTKTVTFERKLNGLNLLGFIHPKEIQV